MVKAYPDTKRENDTIVLCKGRYGKEERVLMLYLSRQGIYDYFVYSPYTLDLSQAVGDDPKINGGGIHSNGDIILEYDTRLENISEFSAGKDGSIYYACTQYQPPYIADKFDGIMDGQAPIPRLSDLSDLYRDDRISYSGPFGYYKNKIWTYKTDASKFVYDNMDGWPTDSFLNTERKFCGNNEDRYLVEVYPGVFYNDYNTWIKPYRLDEEGNQIETTWSQIPAELDEEWAWSKAKELKASF